MTLTIIALLCSLVWCLVGVVEAVIAEERMTYADAVETLVLVLCAAALWELR